MRPRVRTRSFLAIAALFIPACSAPVVNVPAPWEAVEPQSADPPSLGKPTPVKPTWDRIGASVRGKALQASTIGDGSRRIYIIGGIHGDEPEAPAAAELLPELLLESDLKNSTVRVLKDMNPDGGAAKTRTNTRRVDLERNWPAKNFIKDDRSGGRPLSELETAAVHADLATFKPDIVIVFQSANLPPSVSFQGPGRMLGHDFTRAARTADPRWRFVPQPRQRTPGSIESLYGGDRGKVVLRVEFQRSRDAQANAKSVLAGLLALDEQAPAPQAQK